MKNLVAVLAFLALPVFAAEPTVGDNALINGALNGDATGWNQTGVFPWSLRCSWCDS